MSRKPAKEARGRLSSSLVTPVKIDKHRGLLRCIPNTTAWLHAQLEQCCFRCVVPSDKLSARCMY